MASTQVKSNKMRRLESKKSHSWWWDSHISPKNSKWLQENLQEMDHSVKRMLKLIEEDADSFAKKVEMYFKKRPELINLVEEFYRVYQSLAERYDNVTGELRKNIPSDLQSQGSGISDIGSEPPSTVPSPDPRPTQRKSGPRAAGFEFFLGNSGNSSDFCTKGDESSLLDSESESDDSSINNYSGTQSTDVDQGMPQRIIELEAEHREMKEKLRTQQKQILELSVKKSDDENSEVLAKLVAREEELRAAKQKILLFQEEISRLTIEIQKYKSLEDSNDTRQKDAEVLESDVEVERYHTRELQKSAEGSEAEDSESVNKIQTLEEELRITRAKLRELEKEVASAMQDHTRKESRIQILQDQLKSAQKEVSVWKTKVEREKREASKLQDRIARYKSNLADRDQEIRGLKEAVSNANKSLSEENNQLQAEITRTVKERTYLEDNLKELDLRCQTLGEDVRRVKAGKEEMENMLGAQVEQLNAEITERNDHIEELNKSLNELKLKYDILMAEKDNLNATLAEFSAEINSKEDRVDKMNDELITARELAEDLRSRVKELEIEVEKRQEIIMEGAEEKREAIRQLCFSLEHYRSGYHQLRQAVIGHTRLPVMAS
ncbi:protein NETWORKED 4A-like [Olea europaea var. sylvestris]|uniref:protein NETWORKED 4A-like n=1 Tax=Olea europaea var. sylvestris TaxID=158386 RepID=UPI000C1D656A|nr:protein NETWORKED 4A-like [Olea europaea var. sylvestris]XP_022856005.1 protein NETWORKED 4A-like [Olea europaea var. sylvestris]XP_022856006.1 protein NETWORKED 4A-like [Olea europaea var. sylvestris]XP_022856007.1 protein NETWORKED 4A-like [Olea europaea var. sylvestris]XP_022856008.1 protein NETWORKED 4A-like [Olea europaea var. sylvestris]XP_022856009.1 protein NETWORKED 4A-like [Olea europaea var. sylvestris]XP_022856010.1 protein NETWORKED 4A-like [Olea europaea var. sylvestris]XP_0